MSLTMKGNSEIPYFSWSTLDLPENWNQFLNFLLNICSVKDKFTIFYNYLKFDLLLTFILPEYLCYIPKIVWNKETYMQGLNFTSLET